MSTVLYVYDVKKGKQRDPRRTLFNKELFGYKYKWLTKEGPKEKFRLGLLQRYKAKRIGDSVISVNLEFSSFFDELFRIFNDVISVRKFLVEKEIFLNY
ncbi:MAG: hypothetical protein OdinLCB4_003355 [Candidatus Odinarchaeum yellowstonii]|uniref:Uncharacterized protein n=1 Tax=Odinarchaeota yellowstonii (strain LCB_4) TaxID=1841599 RepID=A0AAF0D3C4_ODILC|nr:MAG: hypothetical protein OdinLCB4_003355 [Candidatus Odinarchaeum yellowstonii]